MSPRASPTLGQAQRCESPADQDPAGWDPDQQALSSTPAPLAGSAHQRPRGPGPRSAVPPQARGLGAQHPARRPGPHTSALSRSALLTPGPCRVGRANMAARALVTAPQESGRPGKGGWSPGRGAPRTGARPPAPPPSLSSRPPRRGPARSPGPSPHKEPIPQPEAEATDSSHPAWPLSSAHLGV